MGFSISHGKSMDVTGWGIDQTQLPPFEAGRINPRQWFALERQPLPLDLEIGSGKGTFLVQQATASPQVNFLGIEYAAAFWRYAADRCRRHNLGNVRLLHTEASFFIRNYVPDAAFRQVHIYFPDPWPKKRHHKRRLVQEPFLRELHRVLEPAAQPGHGLIRLATDHSDYYQWMLQHAALAADLFEPLPFESPASAGEGELVGTNFERKYRREGRPFHGMILRKR
ncbi:MAG: tRNA (guanosine(46)-N7)-methyltransferase TrmB [Phycisphaeraceae bacterium]|nr:tRNA (guanosine(46)-N7)-methyltransferase TrmB [Phycisphaeraceae bacterium]